MPDNRFRSLLSCGYFDRTLEFPYLVKVDAHHEFITEIRWLPPSGNCLFFAFRSCLFLIRVGKLTDTSKADSRKAAHSEKYIQSGT